MKKITLLLKVREAITTARMMDLKKNNAAR